jgi:putative peptidoglycan lipid II flippase
VTRSDLGHQRLIQVLLTGALLTAAMLLGLAGQALIAYFFGAGVRSDALFLARDVSDLAAKALLTAQATGVLVPFVLSLSAREDQRVADRALAAILAAVALAGTALAVVVVLLAGPLVAILAPGFDDATADLATDLLRIIAIMAPFVAVAALASVALQARQRFGRAMAGNVFGGVALLAAMPALVHAWGVEGAAAAMAIGAVVQAICGWAFLMADGMPGVVAPWAERAAVGDFVRRTLPFVPYAAVSQGSGVTLRIAASTLGTGLYTSFALAYRLYRSVISLLLTPIQQVLLPALSASEAGDRRAAADDELVATIRYAAFVLMPVAVVLVALSGETVSVVFERGAFTPDDADSTAEVLALFSLSLLPNALYVLLEQSAYARRHTRLVVRTNVALEVVQGALYVPLVLLLGVAGIPVAALLGLIVAVTSYVVVLRPARLRAHASFALRLALCGAVMLAAVLVAAELVERAVDPPPGIRRLLIVVPAVVVGAAAYLIAARAARLSEPRRLTELLAGVLQRPQ